MGMRRFIAGCILGIDEYEIEIVPDEEVDTLMNATKKYQTKHLSLYERQLKKWRNDIDNWDDRNIKRTEARLKSIKTLLERNEKFYVGF